jgi:hypothetical protein
VLNRLKRELTYYERTHWNIEWQSLLQIIVWQEYGGSTPNYVKDAENIRKISHQIIVPYHKIIFQDKSSPIIQHVRQYVNEDSLNYFLTNWGDRINLLSRIVWWSDSYEGHEFWKTLNDLINNHVPVEIINTYIQTFDTTTSYEYKPWRIR